MCRDGGVHARGHKNKSRDDNGARGGHAHGSRNGRHHDRDDDVHRVHGPRARDDDVRGLHVHRIHDARVHRVHDARARVHAHDGREHVTHAQVCLIHLLFLNLLYLVP